MEFRILGPLEVRCDGRAIAVGGEKRRALLSVLLLALVMIWTLPWPEWLMG